MFFFEKSRQLCAFNNVMHSALQFGITATTVHKYTWTSEDWQCCVFFFFLGWVCPFSRSVFKVKTVERKAFIFIDNIPFQSNEKELKNGKIKTFSATRCYHSVSTNGRMCH